MITYVNKNNADKYSFLYSQASQDLRTHDANGNEVPMGSANALLQFTELSGDKALTIDEYVAGRYYIKNAEGAYVLCEDSEDKFNPDLVYYQSDDITSLDEYFSYIVELNKISKRYTILPLDEEVFEIDANTRTITVPNSFKNNGISVQGDEVAEIVYFRINRFFDAMDLTLRDIYIEWKSAAKDENGKEITGVSVPWVIDAESDPGYIVFGWALSSKITQAAGTVTFAVRFYTFDKEKELLEYSLSTLQQTATIKPSLNFNLKDIIMDGSLIDDPDTLISDRFKNSQLSSGAVQAEIPVWILDLKTADDTLIEVDPETKKNIVYVNLTEGEDGFKTIALTRDVQAMASDAGQLSYTWKKYDIDTNKKLDLDFEITMVRTADTERVPGKLYYIADGETVFVLAPDTTVFNPEAEGYDPSVVIYEKVSRGVINSIGKYLVVCTNRVKNSTAINETWTLVVPRPVEPVIDKGLAERGILVEASEFTHVLSVETSVTDAGKMTYQWYKMAPGATDFVEIAGATDSTYQIKGGAPTEDDSVAGCEGDGYYKVKITNNLNTEVTGERAIDDIESSVCRITHAAEPLVISVESELSYAHSDILDGDKIAVSATHKPGSGEPIQRTEDDKITYQWYKYIQGPGANVDDDVEAAEAGTYVLNHDRIMENATEPSYSPAGTGYYFCEVTNHYNGTTASKISRFFTIVDA